MDAKWVDGCWLWQPALIIAGSGVASLGGLEDVPWTGQLILISPHLAGVILVALAGRLDWVAGLIALGGGVSAACLSWFGAMTRQTEGFEYRFNNAMAGLLLTCVGWVALALAGAVAVAVLAYRRPPSDPYWPASEYFRQESSNSGTTAGRMAARSAHQRKSVHAQEN